MNQEIDGGVTGATGARVGAGSAGVGIGAALTGAATATRFTIFGFGFNAGLGADFGFGLGLGFDLGEAFLAAFFGFLTAFLLATFLALAGFEPLPFDFVTFFATFQSSRECTAMIR
jgi:hypothetical protein